MALGWDEKIVERAVTVIRVLVVPRPLFLRRRHLVPGWGLAGSGSWALGPRFPEVLGAVSGSWQLLVCGLLLLGLPSARTLFGDRWGAGGGGRASRSAWLRGGGQGATSRPWLRVTLRCVGSGTLAALAVESVALFFAAQAAMSASRSTWWASRVPSSGNQSILIDSRAARTAADTPSCGLSRMLCRSACAVLKCRRAAS